MEKVEAVPEEEGAAKDKLLTIKTEALVQRAKETDFILKPNALPENQVKATYFQLGKIFVFKLKVAQAEEALLLAKQISVVATGVEDQLFASNCHRLIKEAHLKVYSPRKKQALDEADKHIKIAIGIIERVLGSDCKNYILARALISQGDIYTQHKKNDDAEQVVLRAQTMIGEKYSDNHPCILEFNSNLVEVYSNKTEESEKIKSVQIAEKNLEIARQYYGEENIFTLKHELALASNKIGALQLTEAQENIANMRKIVQHFHDDNPRELMNQYLFLGQVLIAITLMSTTSADSAERILTYVMMKQLEYVEGSRTHPFLEQTVTNLAIFKRSQQDFHVSLQLWEQLKRIQEQVYGEDNEVIIYTYKNIGICYLALGIPDKAEEYYKKALDLMTLISGS